MANEKPGLKSWGAVDDDGEYGWPGTGAGPRVSAGRLQPSPSSAPRRAATIRGGGGLAFAGVLWVLDLRLGAALVVVAVISLFLVSVFYPAAGRMIDAGLVKVARSIARTVSTSLLAMVYFLLITPVSLFLRLVGRDLLAAPGTSSVSTWVIKPRESEPEMVRRQFTVEPGMLAGRRRGPGARARFFVMVTVRAAVLLVALDLVVGTAYMHVRSDPEDRYYDALASTAALVDDKWAVDYFREFRNLEVDWRPLLGMVPEDHKGKYINIGQGARTTYSAAGVKEDATSVYFFGGSTTWGLGQRDQYTIPSYVAELAEEEGVPVRVSNYGQPGWGIWQELLLLQQLLAKGNVPDVAVFYDGHNDVGLQVQEIATDPSYPRAKLVREAVKRERKRGSFSGLMGSFTSLYRAPPAEGVFGKPRSMVARVAMYFSARRSRPAPTPELTQARAHNAVTLHNRAVGVIRRLSETYGFEAVFIWQPNAYTTAGDDAAQFASRGRENFGPAYLAATELVGPPVIDLSDSLDGVKDSVFFDHVHTNELGAASVAQAIYPHLRLER